MVAFGAPAATAADAAVCFVKVIFAEKSAAIVAFVVAAAALG